MEAIIKTQFKTEKYFEEECFITEILNDPSNQEVSISQAKVKPGVTTVLHRLLNTDEKYYILSGEGKMEVGGVEAGLVQQGDVVIIPKNISQRITNTSTTSDLIFLCICTPRFEFKNYVAV